ncbi:MAG: signal peptidase II [Candidatus Woesearchaeota archaeon]
MVLKSSNSGKFRSKNVKVRGYYTLIFFLILVFFDRITKTWAISSLKESKDFGILAFTYVLNTGAGFSIMHGMNNLLIIISLIAIIAIIYYNKDIPRFSLIMILSGIFGNLIDRVTYGGVIDFINLKFWPIFNLADSMIFIGVVYWTIIIFKNDKKTSNENQHNDKKMLNPIKKRKD